MNSKNYQTTSLEHFISLFEKNPLEFPLNILEIKPTHYTQYYKKITKTTQKQGWANASKKIKSNWFLRLFYKTNIGNRSALEWVLNQYKEKKPRDKTIAEKFNRYHFADYKEEVIELLQKVRTISVKTMEIIKEMEEKKS